MSLFDWSDCSAVERSDGKMSGAWVFRGTRIPVKSLFENLEDGATVDDFLKWFPGVGREQVLAVLELRREVIEGCRAMADVYLEIEREYHPLEEELHHALESEPETLRPRPRASRPDGRV